MVYRIKLIDTAILLTGSVLLFFCYTTVLPFTRRNFEDYTSEEVSSTEGLQLQYVINFTKPEHIAGGLSTSFLHGVKQIASLNESEETAKGPAQHNVSGISTTAPENKIIPVDKNLLSYIYKEGHLIPNPDLCPGFGDGVKVVILITTAPDHYEARHGIRLTWGHFGQRSDIALAFVVGTTSHNEVQTKIESESTMYGDIIQGHFVDTYVNLTLKTLSMMEWVGRYCYKARFFLKTDDDMFINVPMLLQLAKEKWDAKRTIYGSLAVGFTPNRDPKNQYYIPYNSFAGTVFPHFTTGPAYLVTMDSVHDLYRRTLQHKFVNLEDVLITGVMAETLQIARVGVDKFVQGLINHNTCEVKSTYAIHGVKYEDQFKYWATSMSLEKCP